MEFVSLHIYHQNNINFPKELLYSFSLPSESVLKKKKIIGHNSLMGPANIVKATQDQRMAGLLNFLSLQFLP